MKPRLNWNNRRFLTQRYRWTRTFLTEEAAELVSRSFTTVSWQNPYPVLTPDALGDERAGITSQYLVKILTSRVYDAAVETPTAYAAGLSRLLSNDIYLKREDTQPVFSFKIRGAFNKIAHLSAEQLSKGVVACSAGNHAQGVAMSAAKLGINATIVMPEMTPSIKVSAVKRLGGKHATVCLHGVNYDEAAAEANRLVRERGLTMVHPFDDPLVIAGQGTIGLEILKVLLLLLLLQLLLLLLLLFLLLLLLLFLFQLLHCDHSIFD